MVRSIFSWFNGVEGTISEMYKNVCLLEDANGIEYQVYYHHLRDRAGEKRNNPLAQSLTLRLTISYHKRNQLHQDQQRQ